MTRVRLMSEGHSFIILFSNKPSLLYTMVSTSAQTLSTGAAAQQSPGPAIIQPPYVAVSAETEVARHPVQSGKFSFQSDGGRGYMILFRESLSVAVLDATILSGVDEHMTMTIQLEDTAFTFMSALQDAISARLLNPAVSHFPASFGPTSAPNIRTSAISGKHYAKIKVRQSGRKSTIGTLLDGSNAVPPFHENLLRGMRGNFVVAFDGVYVSPQRCGLVVRLDMFRITAPPLPMGGAGQPEGEDTMEGGGEQEALRRAMLRQL